MMLQETLLAMKNSLEKFNKDKKLVTEDDINNVVGYFSKLKKGSFIFPMKLISEVKIDIDKGYQIFTNLEDHKFIEPIFQIYCHECNSFQKGYYLTLIDIPDEEICAFCHEELGDSNIMVRYRVIKD